MALLRRVLKSSISGRCCRQGLSWPSAKPATVTPATVHSPHPWAGDRTFGSSSSDDRDEPNVSATAGAQPNRGRQGAAVDECNFMTQLGAASNVVLAGGKCLAGYLSGSPAMIADGVHSVSDLLSDGVTLWTLHAARRPRDDSLPYGYGRVETLGALSVAALVVASGAGIGLHAADSLQTLCASSVSLQTDLWIAISAAGVSVLVKEALYRATLSAGERAGSKVVMANAWHHRSDALSSLIALVGIGGAMAGQAVLDPLAGLAVSGLVVRSGLRVGWDSVHELADGGLEGNVLSAIKQDAAQTEGVLDCHSLRGRRMGPYISVDLCVDVDPWTSISMADQIRREVVKAVQEKHEEVIDVFVTALPAGANPMQAVKGPTDGRSQSWVQQRVRQVIGDEFPEVKEVSHLTCHVFPHNPAGFVVIVDIVVGEECLPGAVSMAKRLQNSLQAIDGVIEADIHLDLTGIPSEQPSAPKQ